ncbi:MAG: SDR family oxidoreductase [Alphaproteobacteria bacterium]|jgi:3-oxoacyl-[acyl-carrier protein] reductase|nr:SDR family oxidoreductase [Alphaproteobacteria bacterium]
MDLGIKGKKAIVCASSRGLGLGCAHALARNGVDVVINGRDRDALDNAAKQIQTDCDVQVTPVIADICTADGQAAVLAACPAPDILINNNGGPPFRDFRELDRPAMIDGVIMNMVTPIELITAVIDGMAARGFGRIVNITSMSVKMPIEGLDLSSGARAGLTAFLAGVAPQVAQHDVTINNLLPGLFDTDRLRGSTQRAAEQTGRDEADIAAERASAVPAGRFGNPVEFGETCAFLCSANAGYITSQNLLIDGGRYPGTF